MRSIAYDGNLNEAERKRVWREFATVSTNSLGNFESQKYESLVEEHLTVSAVIGCKMSLEVN
jgi:hypothetical protein